MIKLTGALPLILAAVLAVPAIAYDRDQARSVQAAVGTTADGAFGPGSRAAAEEWLASNPESGLPAITADNVEEALPVWFGYFKSQEVLPAMAALCTEADIDVTGLPAVVGQWDAGDGLMLDYAVFVESIDTDGAVKGYYAQDGLRAWFQDPSCTTLKKGQFTDGALSFKTYHNGNIERTFSEMLSDGPKMIKAAWIAEYGNTGGWAFSLGTAEEPVYAGF